MKMMVLLCVLVVSSTQAITLDSFSSKESVLNELVHREDRSFVKEVKIDWIDEELKGENFPLSSICGGALIPQNKSQIEKEYHVEVSISFERTLPGPHPQCAVAQRTTSKCRRLSGEELNQCLWKNLRCLQLRKQVFKVLSDTYKDSCNNSFRGFAVVSFATPGEEINDSVSPGHSLEVDQVFSGGIRSYRDGPISTVPLERFLLVKPIF